MDKINPLIERDRSKNMGGFGDLDKYADKAKDAGSEMKDKAKKAYEELTE